MGFGAFLAQIRYVELKAFRAHLAYQSWAALVIASFCASFAYAASLVPSSITVEGIAQIQAHYTSTDLDPSGSDFLGEGSIIELNHKHYLLTNSHMVGGAESSIVEDGKRIELAGLPHLIDNDTDIALVELPPGTYADATKALTDSHMLTVARGLPLSPSIDIKQAKSLMQTIFTAPGSEPFVPVPASVPRVPDFNQSLLTTQRPADGGIAEVANRNFLQSTLYGDLVTSPTQLQRGMSGLPLIGKDSKGAPKLAGVFVSAYVPFRNSYFLSEEAIKRLMQQFSVGKRGSPSNSNWKVYPTGKLLYLQYSDGSSELNPVSPPSGDARTPGGDARTPGGDVRTSGGSEQSRNDIELLDHFEPGMLYKGRPALAFKIGNSWVWADQISQKVYNQTSRNLPTPPLSVGASLAKVFSDRYGLPTGGELTIKTQDFECHSTPGGALARNQYELHFNKDGKLTVKFGVQDSAGNGPDDTVEFTLGEHGGFIDQAAGGKEDKFKPYITVKGRGNKKSYLIDVHSLYFQDLYDTVVEPGMDTRSPLDVLDRVYRDDAVLRFRDNTDGKAMDRSDTEVRFDQKIGQYVEKRNASGAIMPLCQRGQYEGESFPISPSTFERYRAVTDQPLACPSRNANAAATIGPNGISINPIFREMGPASIQVGGAIFMAAAPGDPKALAPYLEKDFTPEFLQKHSVPSAIPADLITQSFKAMNRDRVPMMTMLYIQHKDDAASQGDISYYVVEPQSKYSQEITYKFRVRCRKDQCQIDSIEKK